MGEKFVRSFRIGVLVLLLFALFGLAFFSLLVRQAVTVEDAAQADAERRIADIRVHMLSKAPLVEIDDDGRLVRMVSPTEGTGRPLSRLASMHYVPIPRT